METKEQLEKELSELENQFKENQEIVGLKDKINQLKVRIEQTNFQRKHPILLKFTRSWENTTKRIFKGIGVLAKQGANNLSKNVAKENTNKTNQIEGALNTLD